jgi:hypothetical protein
MIKPLGLVAVLLAASLGACAKPLTAADMPRPKPGLWALAGLRNGTAFQDSQCLSGARVHVAVGDQNCPQKSWSAPSAGVYDLAAICLTPPSTTMRISERYSGDFQQSYKLVEHDSVTNPGSAPIIVDTKFTYSFVGPCPPGSPAQDLY